MKVPSTVLYDVTKSAADKIIKVSKKPCTIGEQMVMTNYFGFLSATKEKTLINFAKINLLR